MATIEGARALGLEKELGSLEAGKRADFSVVTLRNPGANPIEEVVLRSRIADIRKTFLGGTTLNIEVEEFDKEVRRIQLKLKEG